MNAFHLSVNVKGDEITLQQQNGRIIHEQTESI
jgi:hypothetical protein